MKSFNVKTSENSFHNVDPTDEYKKYLGKKYYKQSSNTGIHIMKCVICGDWFEYEITPSKVKQYMKEMNWHLQRGEKEHCGTSRCNGFHREKLSEWDLKEIQKGLDFYAGCDEESKEFKYTYEKAMDNHNRRS